MLGIRKRLTVLTRDLNPFVYNLEKFFEDRLWIFSVDAAMEELRGDADPDLIFVTPIDYLFVLVSPFIHSL